MKQIQLVIVFIALPFLAKAQWQSMVDRIFNCHALRFEYGSWDYQEYYDMWENLPSTLNSRDYFESFDWGTDQRTSKAIKFVDKRGMWSNECGGGKRGYLFSDGDGEEKGLIIFLDEIYSNCRFYIGPVIWGRPAGYGRYYSSDGRMLMEGDFYGQDDDSHPVYNYPNNSRRFQTLSFEGAIYLGEIQNGTMDGTGIYIWSNGSAWFGQWKNGVRNGHGMELYTNCSIKRGYWYVNDYYINKQ